MIIQYGIFTQEIILYSAYIYNPLHIYDIINIRKN